MSAIELIKAIREKTGLPLSDINKAIVATDSQDESVIIDYLRKQGVLKSQSRSGRSTSNGRIFSYVHEGRIGVLLEILCETDFVARSQEFINFGNDVCLHLAAYNPRFVSPETVDSEFLAKETEIALAQLAGEDKPENIKEKILEGKLNKIKEESSLLTQIFLKNSEITVGEALATVSQTTGEKLEIKRFTSFILNS